MLSQKDAPIIISCVAEDSVSCPCELANVCGKKSKPLQKPLAPKRLVLEVKGEIPGK